MANSRLNTWTFKDANGVTLRVGSRVKLVGATPSSNTIAKVVGPDFGDYVQVEFERGGYRSYNPSLLIQWPPKR